MISLKLFIILVHSMSLTFDHISNMINWMISNGVHSYKNEDLIVVHLIVLYLSSINLPVIQYIYEHS